MPSTRSEFADGYELQQEREVRSRHSWVPNSRGHGHALQWLEALQIAGADA
jgi:hypothetical protein